MNWKFVVDSRIGNYWEFDEYIIRMPANGKFAVYTKTQHYLAKGFSTLEEAQDWVASYMELIDNVKKYGPEPRI